MDDLTAAQQDELCSMIRQGCVELEQSLERSSASSKPIDLDEPIGRLSRVAAMQQQQMALAGRQAQTRRLQLLRNALQAIASNQYGTCRRCEEPIGYQRLKVQPESPFCRECQSCSEKL
ncbi:TraR/DksA family transcriptional regulator [Geopsychrobacter electrodiphilus]|uniref:TraR/DksA family transcriptional regulator n=1 Tax=Geopsychrobacter electrodiphilus TaxID=225196 RepID=UPI0003645C0A|nr:TraR/DksA C4-type zinc finger protein [Geopsychrobacter electrodiphilus]